ncbi:hypothetical protein PybrP1_012443 [[Pythium] brassicae (nom. inval.)]|nr:hypothetical protein PybrP1_012443 [[Pythium] brassicae (nom. inval.)]
MTPEGTVHDENPALVHQLHEHDHGELNVKNEYMESSSDGETIKALDQPTTTQKPVMPTQDQFQDIYSPPSSHATPPSKPNSVEMATIYKNASAKSSFDDGQIKGFNEEEVERGASASGSGPLHRGGRVVFSLVLADSTEDWNARFLLGLHEPIRHALFAIDCFFARIQPRSSPAEWNGIEFFTWFKASFTEFVKNQHEVKTAVIQPLVLLKVSAKSDIQNGSGGFRDNVGVGILGSESVSAAERHPEAQPARELDPVSRRGSAEPNTRQDVYSAHLPAIRDAADTPCAQAEAYRDPVDHVAVQHLGRGRSGAGVQRRAAVHGAVPVRADVGAVLCAPRGADDEASGNGDDGNDGRQVFVECGERVDTCKDND